MIRLTKQAENGASYLEAPALTCSPEGYTGEAVERLALFETICLKLLSEQEALSVELSKLRLEGKTHSYHYKEKMGKKLINGNTLTLLRANGVDV